ncbi:MAG: U32 family peptidase [Lentisphaerae bacterium]|jgi:putative protease|nr:U32 family peptidase [Lentisphaerota bacterium]
MELLAPAGNLESAIAAFTYGADAVYLGLRQFSARGDAENFSYDDLSTLLGHAHEGCGRRRSVYVAVNTLVRQGELGGLVDTLSALRDMCPDGLIVQDWALLELVKSRYPEFVLHASTQLAIHNVEGARRAKELGFKRIVVARELTIQEIAEIASIPGLEVEVFVHGALCYSYSGLCQLSGVLRDSSGNRGECAYVCRKKCNLSGPEGVYPACNPMSMKDLATPDLLGSFARLGVASLKIEGRKKSPLYVAAVTRYYRGLLDGSLRGDDQVQCESEIKSIFSRPWTTFHLKNRRQAGVTDTKIVGHRGVPVGVVTEIVKGTPDRLRFTLKGHALEKYDGLQIDLPTRDRPYGFSVSELRLYAQKNVESWTSVFVAEAGSTIEVPLPEDHPPIPVGAVISCSSSQHVKQSYSWELPRSAQCRHRDPLDFTLEIDSDSLELRALSRIGDRQFGPETTRMAMESPLEVAKQPEKLMKTIGDCLGRLGDSRFSLGNLDVVNPGGYFVPSSLLNELRRQAVEGMEAVMDRDLRRHSDQVKGALDKYVVPEASGGVRCSMKIDRPFYLNMFTAEELGDFEEIVYSLDRIDVDEVEEALDELIGKVGAKSRIRLALPTIVRGDSGPLRSLIRTLYGQGWRRWMVTNIGSLSFLGQSGIPLNNLHITSDWQLYVTNVAAAKQLLDQGFREVTLSPEDTSENWRSLLGKIGPRAQVVLYQDTPLAISDVCIKASIKGFCQGKTTCGFQYVKLNTFDNDNLIAINNNCQSVIINGEPFNRIQDAGELIGEGARHFRVDFIWKDYNPTDVRRIARQAVAELNHFRV